MILESSFKKLLITSDQTSHTVLYDISKKETIMEYDSTSTESNCIYPLTSTSEFLSLDGFFSLKKGNNILSYYQWNKKFPTSKFSVNEELNSITISPNSEYFAGGSSSGQLYIWQIASGRLITQVSSHKKAITAINFSMDGKWLATGSSDTTVKLYQIEKLVSNQENTKPLYTLPHHKLTITTLYIGTGNIHHSKLYSTSLDNTFQIHQLNNGSLIAKIQLSNMIHSLFIDMLERYAFCALDDCQIAIIDLKSNFEQTFLIGHHHPVTCLQMTTDGTRLFSADRGGFLLEWNLSTKKLVSSIQLFKNQSISNIIQLRDTTNSEFTPPSFQKSISSDPYVSLMDNQISNNFVDELPSESLMHQLSQKLKANKVSGSQSESNHHSDLQRAKLESKLEELNTDLVSMTDKYVTAKAQLDRWIQ